MSTIAFAVEARPDLNGGGRSDELPDTVEVVPVVDATRLTDLIHNFERETRMERRAVSYGGLIPAFFKFGPARVHFTASQGAFVRPPGKVPLLGCSCGEWGCWPLLARVTTTAVEVRWSDFEQPFRRDRDYSAFGPFVFDRQDYDRALATLSKVWDEAVMT